MVSLNIEIENPVMDDTC